jgi:hypothetical protein
VRLQIEKVEEDGYCNEEGGVRTVMVVLSRISRGAHSLLSLNGTCPVVFLALCSASLEMTFLRVNRLSLVSPHGHQHLVTWPTPKVVYARLIDVFALRIPLFAACSLFRTSEIDEGLIVKISSACAAGRVVQSVDE